MGRDKGQAVQKPSKKKPHPNSRAGRAERFIAAETKGAAVTAKLVKEAALNGYALPVQVVNIEETENGSPRLTLIPCHCKGDDVPNVITVDLDFWNPLQVA